MTPSRPRLRVLARAFGAVGLLVAALAPVVSAEPAASTTHVVQPGETLSGIAESIGLTSVALARLNRLDDANVLAVGQSLMLPAGSPASAPIAAPPAPSTPPAPIAPPASASIAVPPAPPASPAPNAPLVASASVAAPSVSSLSARTYTVVDGDTLWGIAQHLATTTSALVDANRLDDADHLTMGAQLIVPSAAGGASSGGGQSASAGNNSASAGSGSVSAGSGSASVSSQAATAAGPAPGAAPKVAVAPRRSLLVPYTVQPGETLNQIARQFDLKPDTVIQANGLDDPNRLSVGTVLKLPLPGREHVVQSGETLRDIAAQEKVDLGSLVDFNAIDDPELIRVGQVVVVPPAPSLQAAASETDAAQRVAPVTAPATAASSPPSAGAPPSAPVSKSSGATAQPASSGPGAAAAGSSTGVAAAGSPAGAAAVSPGAAGGAAAGDGAATGSGQPAPAPAPAPVPAPRAPSAPVASAPAASPDSLAGAGLKLVGSAYVWGGSSPSGFDCSGFVWYVARQAGRPLSRGLLGEFNASGVHPSRDDLKPGDLVFFQNTYAAGLSHNGIYIGNGQFVHAADEKAGVTVSSLSAAYWQNHWFGATRLS